MTVTFIYYVLNIRLCFKLLTVFFILKNSE
jgi:hypothetical protein